MLGVLTYAGTDGVRGLALKEAVEAVWGRSEDVVPLLEGALERLEAGGRIDRYGPQTGALNLTYRIKRR